MKSIKQLRESNLEEASVQLDNPFDSKHGPDHKSETKHADMMKKNHGVTTKYHRDSGEMSYHGPKSNLKAALHTHYQTDNENDIKDNHPDIYEDVSKKKRSDMARVNAGAMSKSEFDSKYKKPVKKSLAGPGGLYKNLVKEENVDETHKVGDKVKIVGGPKDVHGKMGRIGEIKHGSHKTAAKTYTVDHDAGSVQLGKEHIRAIKEEHGAGEFGTAELTNKYKNATPGQTVEETAGHESTLAAKATVAAARNPSKEAHLNAMKAHKNAQGFFKGQAHDYHLNKAIEHAKKAAELNEEIDGDDICETASAGLAAKAKKTGFALSTLRKVYRRGVAAWNSGHRPGTTPQQWGMARVNSYVTKGKGTYHGADKDLRSGMENSPDKDLQEEKDAASGLPKAYVAGLSTSTAKARAAHFDKADKLSDKDPEAYKPAPGDATSKTKESEHTKKYKAMFGEDMDEEVLEACWDSYKQVGMKMKDGRQVPNCVPKEGTEEDMAKHHDAAQAAKKSGDNDAFHKHMDAKFDVAKKRDAENAKKPVTRMSEALEEACWKGYESLDESVHSVKASKFSQKAKLNPSISTHVRASDAHAKAASSYEKKIAAHIKSGGEASELKPLETMAKSHNRSSTLHKFMAHRLVKQGLKEAVEMAAEAADEKINLKITRHSQLALNAEKRGDKAAQKFHLDMVSKLKAPQGAVNEEAEHDDDQEEIIMAKGQLLKIADMAKDLADSMDDQDELEAWIQVKITTAYDHMDDVHSYVEYTQDLYDDQPEAEKEYATEQMNEDVAANNDAKELARMQMLVRLGLLDRLKLNTVTRAIKKLDHNTPITTTAEKDVLFELLQNLIGAITSDESVFKKIKFNVANQS